MKYTLITSKGKAITFYSLEAAVIFPTSIRRRYFY